MTTMPLPWVIRDEGKYAVVTLLPGFIEAHSGIQFGER